MRRSPSAPTVGSSPASGDDGTAGSGTPPPASRPASCSQHSPRCLGRGLQPRRQDPPDRHATTVTAGSGTSRRRPQAGRAAATTTSVSAWPSAPTAARRDREHRQDGASSGTPRPAGRSAPPLVHGGSSSRSPSAPTARDPDRQLGQDGPILGRHDGQPDRASPCRTPTGSPRCRSAPTADGRDRLLRPRRPGSGTAPRATPIGRPLPHQHCVGSVAFSPDGSKIVTGCHDGTARIWDVAPAPMLGGSILRHQHPCCRRASARTGLPSSPAASTARCRSGRSADGRRARSGTTASSARSVFGPDGRRLLSASKDHTAQALGRRRPPRRSARRCGTTTRSSRWPSARTAGPS